MSAETGERNSDNTGTAPSAGGRRLRFITWGSTGIVLILTIACIVVAATKTPPALVQAPPRIANVEVQRIVAEPFEATLVLPARIEADRSAAISAESAGRLQEWFVEEGEAVEAGRTVAVLNADQLKAQQGQMRAKRLSAEKSVAVYEQQLALAHAAFEHARKEATALELDLSAARSDLTVAEKEYARIKPLAESEVLTAADLDIAANTLTQRQLAVKKVMEAMDRAGVSVQSARLNIAQSEAALDLARAQVDEADEGIKGIAVALAKCELKAPFAGLFEKHLVKPGEVVAVGQPLGRIYDLTRLRARVDVADRYVAFLDQGSPGLDTYLARAMPGAERRIKAAVILPGLPKLTGGAYEGLKLDAVIENVAHASDAASNTFHVELRFENPGEALKEGMIVQARVDYLRYPDAITIPLKAIRVADVGPRVFVAERRDGKDFAAVRDVEPVAIKGESVLVSRGVAAGDRLIVAGMKGVIHGEEINVVMEDGVLVGAASGNGGAENRAEP